jgi:transposase
VRILLRLPLPPTCVPRVLGVDDFALAKPRRCATILIDAETRERVEVLPGRGAETLEAWLREHPGIRIVCRDGSGAYAEAIRREDKGVGLLECARRPNLALNTVKRYARVPEPERLVRAPSYRPTLVYPYREHLRKRRAEDPAVPVLQLLEEIKALGYTAS